MRVSRIIFIFIIILFYKSSVSQEDMWKNYTDNNKANALVVEGDYLWSVTDGVLVKMNIIDTSYEIYKPPDYISLVNTYDVALDSIGNLWFIGQRQTRPIRYNITNNLWTNFENLESLPTTFGYKIVVDKIGKIWFVTPVGLVSYNNEGNIWETIDTTDIPSSGGIEAIAFDSTNNLWAVDNYSVLTRKNNTWVKIDSSISVLGRFFSDIIFDNNDELWVGGHDGLYHYDGLEWSRIDWFKDYTIENIITDKNNNLWFYDSNNIYQYNGDSIVEYDTIAGVSQFYITDFTVDTFGNIWLAEINSYYGKYNGLMKYDGIEWNKIQLFEDLYLHEINDIEIDENGIIWFGGPQGLYQIIDEIIYPVYNLGKYTNYGVRKIILDTNDVIWLTGLNLRKYENDTLIKYNTKMGFGDGSVGDFYLDNNHNIWVTHNGVTKYETNDVKINYSESDGLISNTVYSINSDSKGTMWFGTDKGITKFTGSSWVSFDSIDGYGLFDIYYLRVDSNDVVWFSISNDIYQFDGQKLIKHNLDPEGVTGRINVLEIDSDGYPWVGCRNGVYRYDGKKWKKYTTKDGLVDNWVRSLEFDNNFAWFGTMHGISRYRLDREIISGMSSDMNINNNRLLDIHNPVEVGKIIQLELYGISVSELKIQSLSGVILNLKINQNVSGKNYFMVPQNISPGIYFLRIKGKGINVIKKVVVIK